MLTLVNILRTVERWALGLDEVTEIILAEALRIVATQT